MSVEFTLQRGYVKVRKIEGAPAAIGDDPRMAILTTDFGLSGVVHGGLLYDFRIRRLAKKLNRMRGRYSYGGARE